MGQWIVCLLSNNKVCYAACQIQSWRDDIVDCCLRNQMFVCCTLIEIVNQRAIMQVLKRVQKKIVAIVFLLHLCICDILKQWEKIYTQFDLLSGRFDIGRITILAKCRFSSSKSIFPNLFGKDLLVLRFLTWSIHLWHFESS